MPKITKIPYQASKDIIIACQLYQDAKYAEYANCNYKEITTKYNDIILPANETSSPWWRVPFDEKIIEEYLECDYIRVANILYHSLTITDEQKIFLKMKWNF